MSSLKHMYRTTKIVVGHLLSMTDRGGYGSDLCLVVETCGLRREVGKVIRSQGVGERRALSIEKNGRREVSFLVARFVRKFQEEVLCGL